MVHVRELVHRSLEGDLTVIERQHLDAHLGLCEDCRLADAELRRNDQLLSHREPLPTVPPMRAPEARPSRFVVPSILAVATVVLALVAGTALAAWRAGPAPGSQAAQPSPSPEIVSMLGVCGAAQAAAVSGATRIDRIDVKRLSLPDLVAAGGGQLVTPATTAALNAGKLQGTMVCVVEVVGELHVQLGSGAELKVQLAPGSAGPAQWAIFTSVAGSGDPLGLIAGIGPVPGVFDALPDTRRDLVPGTLVEIVDPQTIRVRLESAKMSEEFGNPALFAANRFTDIRPPNGTLANTGVKVGDRVQIFFERDGRDRSGAYPLSVFRFSPGSVVTPQPPSPRPGDLPVCPAGQTPLLDVSNSGPPGDLPGTGAPSAEEAFRRAEPAITNYQMYQFGTTLPYVEKSQPAQPFGGPVWIVADGRTFIALYIGSPGQNSWFAHPATFLRCMTPENLKPATPSGSPSPQGTRG